MQHKELHGKKHTHLRVYGQGESHDISFSAHLPQELTGQPIKYQTRVFNEQVYQALEQRIPNRETGKTQRYIAHAPSNEGLVQTYIHENEIPDR
jgi:hypothetical protein